MFEHGATVACTGTPVQPEIQALGSIASTTSTRQY